MNEQRTLFDVKVRSHQSDKTKLGATKTGFGMTLAGVLLLGLSIVAISWAGTYWYFVIGAIGGAGLIIGSLIYLLFSLIKPTKSVICLKCAHEHKIFKNALSYVCTNCNELLLLSKDPQQSLAFSTCPYCGLKTAASSDAAPFLCPDCGIMRRTDSKHVGPQKECSGCGFRVPEEAIYCVSCGSMLKTDLQSWTEKEIKDLVNDLDWRAGKSPRGHLYFAKALLHSLSAFQNRDNFKDIEYSPFHLLEESLISLEVAANNEKTHQDCGKLLPEVDRTYARLLNWELSVIESTLSESGSSEGFDKIPVKDACITPRRRLEDLFGEELQKYGSLGKWNADLLKWEQIKSPTGRPLDKYRLVNHDKLKQESTRFAEWVAKSS
jgi:predicted RNA-binding Zn-ribbon protein involved in translation (DUF1610 family)